MKVEVKIDSGLTEPLLVLHTNELTPALANLLASLAEPQPLGLVGYTENGAVLLNPSDLFRVYSEGNRVFADTTGQRYRLKMRLYEAEEKLAGGHVVRISSSELANFKHVKGLDMSLGGTIQLEFTNGEKAFVSRRFVPIIKKMLGV